MPPAPHRSNSFSEDSDRFSAGEPSAEDDYGGDDGFDISHRHHAGQRIQFSRTTHRELASSNVKKASEALPGFSDWRSGGGGAGERAHRRDGGSGIGGRRGDERDKPSSSRRKGSSSRHGRRERGHSSSLHSSHSARDAHNNIEASPSTARNIRDIESDVLAQLPSPSSKSRSSSRSRASSRRSSSQAEDSLPSVPSLPSVATDETNRFSNTTQATMNKYKKLYEAMLEEAERDAKNVKSDAAWVGLGDIREEGSSAANSRASVGGVTEHNTRVANKSSFYNSGSDGSNATPNSQEQASKNNTKIRNKVIPRTPKTVLLEDSMISGLYVEEVLLEEVNATPTDTTTSSDVLVIEGYNESTLCLVDSEEDESPGVVVSAESPGAATLDAVENGTFENHLVDEAIGVASPKSPRQKAEERRRKYSERIHGKRNHPDEAKAKPRKMSNDAMFVATKKNDGPLDRAAIVSDGVELVATEKNSSFHSSNSLNMKPPTQRHRSSFRGNDSPRRIQEKRQSSFCSVESGNKHKQKHPPERGHDRKHPPRRAQSSSFADNEKSSRNRDKTGRDRSRSRGPFGRGGDRSPSIGSQHSNKSHRSGRSDRSGRGIRNGFGLSPSRSGSGSRLGRRPSFSNRSTGSSRSVRDDHSEAPTKVTSASDESNGTRQKKGFFRKVKKLVKKTLGVAGVHKYRVGERARYRVAKVPRRADTYDPETGTVEVEIMSVHVDAVLDMPYYTIRLLPDGACKQTNWDNLLPLSEYRRRTTADNPYNAPYGDEYHAETSSWNRSLPRNRSSSRQSGRERSSSRDSRRDGRRRSYVQVGDEDDRSAKSSASHRSARSDASRGSTSSSFSRRSSSRGGDGERRPRAPGPHSHEAQRRDQRHDRGPRSGGKGRSSSRSKPGERSSSPASGGSGGRPRPDGRRPSGRSRRH